jgi:hypothetical protein
MTSHAYGTWGQAKNACYAEIDNDEDEYGQSVHGKGVEVLRGARGRKHAEHGAHFAEQQKKTC